MCDPSIAVGIASANFRNSLAVISPAVFAYSCIGLTERAVAIDSVRRFPPPAALLHQIVRCMVWVRRWWRGSSGRDNRAGSLRECGFVDSTRGVTGRSDIARWDLQKRTNARRTGRTRALQWGLPRLKAE